MDLKPNDFFEYKCSIDKFIQFISFTSILLIERVKVHLREKKVISNNISNCYSCINIKTTVNDLEI